MSDDNPHAQDLSTMTPRKGAFVLLIPVIAVVLVLGSYVVLIGMGIVGRQATGDRVAMRFTGCTDAQEVVLQRVDHMGLGDPQVTEHTDGFTLHATLPEDDVAERIPQTLATRGRFEVRYDGNPDEPVVTNSDVTGADPRLDLTMIPYTVVRLTPDAWDRVVQVRRDDREGKMSFWLDGMRIGEQTNTRKMENQEFEIQPAGENDLARLRFAAEYSMILDDGPLPCDLTVDTTPAP